MFEIHKCKLLWFTILVFWNFHFYYWPSLVEKLEKELLGHFSFQVAHKESPIGFRRRRPHRGVAPSRERPRGRRRRAHCALSKALVPALLGVADVSVCHARSRLASTCADGVRKLARGALVGGCGSQHGSRSGPPSPRPTPAGLTRGAQRPPRTAGREAGPAAAFEDGPERRVPVRRRPRGHDGPPPTPRRPRPAGFGAGEGLRRQRPRGDPPGAFSSAGNTAQRPDREPSGAWQRLEPAARREGKGPGWRAPKLRGEILPVPGPRRGPRPAAERAVLRGRPHACAHGPHTTPPLN